jgi:alkyl sulfatase BDS1-like metallo-beta-lactamase superfamily hydrolase
MTRKKLVLAAMPVVTLVLALVARRPLLIAFEGSGMDPAIPADYRVPRSIHPELAEHSKLYEKKIFKVGESVHVAVGYGVANIIMVEGTDGIVIVDTGETIAQGEEVLTELREITTKPIVAVVLTHHHADHVLGTTAFVKPGDSIPIIAHDSLVQHYVDETGIIAELQTIRSAHAYGQFLGPADRKDSSNGIGPFIRPGFVGFVAPNKTFHDGLEVTLAGVRFEMKHVPSEAESEIAMYLPDKKILLSAEVVQDHTFPNVYTIRGARYRDPLKWVRSLDVLRAWSAESMVLQHGPPVLGKEEVERVLTVYRDEIQYVHDQTIRYMNKGLTAQEIANVVKLPPHLDAEKPWGRQFYGTVKHSVRNVYGGYVGWFQGDPVDLDPTPPVESARRLVVMMGGRDKVLEAARKAYAQKDDHFAAELATYLIRIDLKDMEARHLKGAAFRRLGYAEINANWRNYYLTSAMELDDQIPEAAYNAVSGLMLGSAMVGLPPESQIGGLPSRLKAEETFSEDVVAAIRYADVKEPFRLHLRRGVLEISRGDVTRATFTIDATQASMGAFLAGKSFDEAFGPSKVTGDATAAARFFAHFETPFTKKPEVVVR